MLDVSDATKRAYQNFGSHKDITVQIKKNGTITLHNTDLVAESVSLKEVIETGDNLSFMGCNASVFSFKCRDITTDIKGAKITVTMKANNTQTVPIFTGYVDTATNGSHEQMTMGITAYDILKDLQDYDLKDWYDDLTNYFPMTLKSFRDSLFGHLYSEFGLQQNDVNLPNDSMTIYKTIEGDTIPCTNVLKWICQINARYGRIDRYGKFDYINLQKGLYPALNLYPSNNLYPGINNIPDLIDKSFYKAGDCDFENFTTQAITRVDLRGKDDKLLAYAGASKANKWTINTNPFIWGYEDRTPLNEVASNIFAEVNALQYTPLIKLNLTGLPYIECGDFISIETKRSVIKVYLLERTLTGIQALKDSYGANGEEKYPIYKPNIKQQTEIVNNQLEEVTENVTEISETLSNLITYGTTDIGVGAPLPTGHIYIVYE